MLCGQFLSSSQLLLLIFNCQVQLPTFTVRQIEEKVTAGNKKDTKKFFWNGGGGAGLGFHRSFPPPPPLAKNKTKTNKKIPQLFEPRVLVNDCALSSPNENKIAPCLEMTEFFETKDHTRVCKKNF